MATHYSPERRTALVLSGTGADGAYHAGVLRALQETGIKVDLVCGRGMGALGAVLHAIDGAARLWEPGGVWRGEGLASLYRWRWPFRWLAGLAVALLTLLAVPLVVLLALTALYPLALALGMLGLDAGPALATGVLDAVAWAFGPSALATWLPRLVLLVALAGVAVLAGGVLVEARRAAVQRTRASGALWSLIGAPLDAAGAVRAGLTALWHILRGGATIGVPDAADLGRRYADLLAEHIGHPGFRELIVVVHDLDARRDMVFGLVREPYRKALFAATTAAAARRVEAHDLGGLARDQVAEVLAAALTPPAVCQPRLVTFASDTPWRGESHRLADRPSALGRAVEEAAAAGAEQIIIVSAAPQPAGPHHLRPVRADALGRVGEQLASAESAALADTVRQLQGRFHGTYLIRPAHNPIRPLDLDGAWDERSDRLFTLTELMELGYEDAHRQFIDPVLGASGERLQEHPS